MKKSAFLSLFLSLLLVLPLTAPVARAAESGSAILDAMDVNAAAALLVDPDTGEETTRTVYGVYAVVGARAEFKPVEILEESGEFYIVASVASDKTALRAGDEIIVSAQDLYDGKVVR